MSVKRSLFLSSPIFFLTGIGLLEFIRTSSASPFWMVMLSGVISSLFLSTLFFLLLYSGKTDRYRYWFFALSSLAFLLPGWRLLSNVKGITGLAREDAFLRNFGLCSITPVSLWTTFFWDRTIIYPTHAHAVAAMILLGIALFFTLGRGWCSWGCPYGGATDSLFSRILRKPVIKNIHPKWTLLPFAILLFVLISSPLTYMPMYCRWLCPLKPVTEYEAYSGDFAAFRWGLSIALFLIFIVALPILTRKRTLCGFFCPLGAIQSLSHRFVPFSIRIQKDRCADCKQCIEICPTLSINENSLANGRTLSSCSRCGSCVDRCPSQAIVFHVAGTQVGAHRELKRYLWLLAAYGFSCWYTRGPIAKVLLEVFKALKN